MIAKMSSDHRGSFYKNLEARVPFYKFLRGPPTPPPPYVHLALVVAPRGPWVGPQLPCYAPPECPSHAQTPPVHSGNSLPALAQAATFHSMSQEAAGRSFEWETPWDGALNPQIFFAPAAQLV